MQDRAAASEYIEAEAWAQLQLALPPEQQATLATQVIRDGRAVSLLSGADLAWLNRAMAFGFEHALTDERLRAINAPYIRAGIPRWIVEWSPQANPRAGNELLERHGAQARTPTVKFWRPLSGDLPVIPINDVQVVEIGPADAETFQSTVAEALGVPEIAARVVRTTVGHPGWHFYLAVAEGSPIGGGSMFVQGDGVWFGIGATLPAARQRGAQTALLARRLHDAARLCCRWATVGTSPDLPERPSPSYRNMLRAGMQVLYHRSKYVFELNSLPAIAL
jgi:hypothetical protein